MNKNNAHLFLPLVAALAEGKIIQHRMTALRENWVDMTHNLAFDCDPAQYRIKPEPKVIYAIMCETKTWGRYITKEKAEAELSRAKSYDSKYDIYRCEEILKP